MTTPRNPARPPGPNPRPTSLRARFRLGAVGAAAALAAALTGCASQAVLAGPPIVLVSAYVGQPQGAAPTDAYVALRNDGRADRLISARTSVGGTVTMRGPARQGSEFMRSYRDIPIPAHSFVRLIPNGYHLVITGARP